LPLSHKIFDSVVAPGKTLLNIGFVLFDDGDKIVVRELPQKGPDFLESFVRVVLIPIRGAIDLMFTEITFISASGALGWAGKKTIKSLNCFSLEKIFRAAFLHKRNRLWRNGPLPPFRCPDRS
jgi:hypothetical protein